MEFSYARPLRAHPKQPVKVRRSRGGQPVGSFPDYCGQDFAYGSEVGW